MNFPTPYAAQAALVLQVQNKEKGTQTSAFFYCRNHFEFLIPNLKILFCKIDILLRNVKLLAVKVVEDGGILGIKGETKLI